MDQATERELVIALQLTWQAIGGDVIAALGRDATAEEVRENVPDCLSSFGHRRPAEATRLAKAFGALPFDQQDAVLEKAFPLASYGM